MAEPYVLSASEAAEQIRSQQLSPTDYADALLQRIDRHEPTLQAWVTIDREEVLDTARQRQEGLEKGNAGGVLHGVPVGLKDIFYTAGMKTTACSRIYADLCPPTTPPA